MNVSGKLRRRQSSVLISSGQRLHVLMIIANNLWPVHTPLRTGVIVWRLSKKWFVTNPLILSRKTRKCSLLLLRWLFFFFFSFSSVSFSSSASVLSASQRRIHFFSESTYNHADVSSGQLVSCGLRSLLTHRDVLDHQYTVAENKQMRKLRN